MRAGMVLVVQWRGAAGSAWTRIIREPQTSVNAMSMMFNITHVNGDAWQEPGRRTG
jgi:hypothetical protein